MTRGFLGLLHTLHSHPALRRLSFVLYESDRIHQRTMCTSLMLQLCQECRWVVAEARGQGHGQRGAMCASEFSKQWLRPLPRRACTHARRALSMDVIGEDSFFAITLDDVADEEEDAA